eukprot:jgi/Psemu1/67347/estExt_Genemark1.C_3050054
MTSSSSSSSFSGNTAEKVHETRERIPRLDSAPTSGVSLVSNDTDNESPPFALPPPPPPFRTTPTGNLPVPTPPPLPLSSSSAKYALPPPPRVTTARSGTKQKSRTPPRSGSGTSLSRSVPTSPASPTIVSLQPPPLPPPPPPPPPSLLPPLRTTNSQELSSPSPSPAQQSVEEGEEQQPFSQQDSTPAGPPPPFLPVTTFRNTKFWGGTQTREKKQQQKLRSILARRQTHVPVLIVATEAANQMAWKNGLQLSDLFQGVMEDISPCLQSMTPFRSVGRSLFLNDVRVQFMTASQLDGPFTFEDTQAMMSECVSLRKEDGDVDQDLTLLENRIDEILQQSGTNSGTNSSCSCSDGETQPGESLEEIAKEAYRLTSPMDSMPWLIRYRQALDRSTDVLPHDLINCPPLVLLVCTATKEITNPEDVLQELYQSNHVLPNVYKRGLYDPSKVQQEVLVLHDNYDEHQGSPSFDEPRLRQLLRSRFGANSSILRINSYSPEAAVTLAEQETSDLWGGRGKLGTFLSDNDRVVLRRYFQTLVSAALLPALERRILDLDTIVGERKRGVRNLVRSFWRKPKDESGGSEGSNVYGQSPSSAADGAGGADEEVKYRYDSIESQTLLLADTLFLMEDYTNALAMYRLIRDDYKSDKAWVHHGKVLEMIALCMYQLDPYTRAREIFGLLKDALVVYTRAAEEERMRKDALTRQLGELNIRHTTHKSYITRLASRLSLIIVLTADILARGRDLECADLMASVSSYESSLGAAVLMEQSSVFYYKAGLYRKYAFHMLMSGHMFQKAGQQHHSFRCFASALYIYRTENWDKLYSHLQTALAAQLYTMQRMSIALVLYAKLIGSTGGGKVSVQSQQKFLNHLIEICEGHHKAALAGADRLAVPPSVPRLQRERYRNDRLEQLVSVIRHTRTASRVLELACVNLPKIAHASVRIWNPSDKDYFAGDADAYVSTGDKDSDEPAYRFGTPARGDEAVWGELEIMTIAETNTAKAKDNGDKTKTQSEETITAALAKIEDPLHQRFIAEIDKEKQNRSLKERAKRKSPKSQPKIRARGEPIFCGFSMTNPLSVDVRITELQLVAKMTDRSGETAKTCTNEFAIQLNEGSSAGGAKSEWTFACADDLPFTVPQFCRITEPNVKRSKSARSNPFFVVTKQTVELPADGELSVSLGIAPLIEGDLEIIGVRCKLLDKVWLYHAFDIQGPLLKTTRTNIMNKVRGESVYLKSKIERDMPCLTAELIKRSPPEAPVTEMDDGPLLEGQITTWTVRLRNVGSAPASAITLKTNLPWIDIVKDDTHTAVVENTLTAEEQESESISYCMGPSGTLMALPIQGSIDPSHSLDIQIRVRTSCVGEKQQDFYMLYRYDLCETSEGGHMKRRSRWLRKMYQVPVYPSLSFCAKPMPNYWNGKDLLVAVELTNNRLDRPIDLYITLDRLGLASRRYRLEAMPGQFTKSKEFGDVLQIGWQEQVTVFYRVVLPETDSGSTNACVLSECPFTESGGTTAQECASSSATNHLCLEDAFASFQTAWDAHQLELMRLEYTPDAEKEHPRSIHSIRRAKTSDLRGGSSGGESFRDEDSNSNINSAMIQTTAAAFTAGEECTHRHPTSLGSLCPPSTSTSEIHLTCSWRAILGQEVVRGEHYLRRIPIAPRTLYEHGYPIAASAEHPSILEHDFSKSPSVRIPVALTLKNRMQDASVTVSWSLDDPSPSLSLSSSSSLEWIGICRQTTKLEADSQITVPLEVLVTQPGVFDLQMLRLLVIDNDDQTANATKHRGDDATHRPMQEWPIRVLDSTSTVRRSVND